MNHLIYTTFGEQAGSVYATQVKQLLNYWSKRENWKVTLIQIADDSNLDELEPDIDTLYIKRKFRLLISTHRVRYAKEIKSRLSINGQDNLYFNSRGFLAYSVASSFLRVYGVKAKSNNLDIRGTLEELKFSRFRLFLYPYFKNRLNHTLKVASSITTVTTELKNHLINTSTTLNPEVNINVVPTLSMMQYRSRENKSNIAYIGKIAWIDKKLFVKQILKINELFNEKGWTISIIGNTSGTLGLEKSSINFIKRMSPVLLEDKILYFHTGLVLRDSSIVNRVAAPCKISDYLCLGMPVIYSGEIGSLKDFLNIYPECSKFIKHIDELNTLEQVSLHTQITQKEMESLSSKAISYFGVDAVIDEYIKFFNN